MSRLYHTSVNHEKFIRVNFNSCLVEVILITGYNLKYVYSYLKDKGRLSYPIERQAFGQVWVYNPDTRDCKSFDRVDYNDILYNRN